jgi:hypothetical protein
MCDDIAYAGQHLATSLDVLQLLLLATGGGMESLGS